MYIVSGEFRLGILDLLDCCNSLIIPLIFILSSSPPPPSTWKDGKAASAKYMTKLKMQEKQTKKYLIKVYKGSRKKSSYLNGLAINAYPPPPPLVLIGRWNKKGSKKILFFLNGPALYPSPLFMARPLREDFF